MKVFLMKKNGVLFLSEIRNMKRNMTIKDKNFSYHLLAIFI